MMLILGFQSGLLLMLISSLVFGYCQYSEISHIHATSIFMVEDAFCFAGKRCSI
jgi:hypothetical protein